MAREDASRAPEHPTGHRPDVLNFYREALEAAQQTILQRAADVEGLDDEIALLRAKLHDGLSGDPQTVRLMLRAIETLVRTVSARYRMSRRAEKELADSAANLLRGFANQLFPEEAGFDDE